VQRLLATLVAAKPGGRIGEAGTAFGEGAAAMAASLAGGATLVTVEPDPLRAAAARERLAGLPVELVEARWQDVLPGRGPFDLIFFDGGARDCDSYDLIIDLLAPGGVLVKDDLTPGLPIEGDPIRELMLRDPRLVGVEILTTPTAAAIIAVRRGEA
jgi:predicted O-methyltransferase YrrM